MSDIKDRMHQIIRDQPDDRSYEEILRELAFHHMIEKGLQDSEQGRTISQDELRRRIGQLYP